MKFFCHWTGDSWVDLSLSFALCALHALVRLPCTCAVHCAVAGCAGLPMDAASSMAAGLCLCCCAAVALLRLLCGSLRALAAAARADATERLFPTSF